MRTKKMYERIDWYKKEFVHERYSRIVKEFKDYDKITKKKMIEAIYKVYSDYNNIIDICTTRELKYLELILNSKSSTKELLSDKYEWEREILRKKFLIQTDWEEPPFVPDEIIDNVKDAIKNVNWDLAKRNDEINIPLVSYCKIQGSALLPTVCSIGSYLTGVSEKELWNHMLNNRLFNYYVIVYAKSFEGLGDDIPVALYQDYYFLEEELEEERKKQGLAGTIPLDAKMFETYFYNDFDINNKKIKKFLDEIQKLPFFWTSALNIVREFAVLNVDREPLKDSIRNVPNLSRLDLTDFFKVLDEAMDEMPSGALNGFTPNQAKKAHAEKEMIKQNKAKQYVKQHNACLSEKDAKLFYKIYFALLEFTNKKYKIKDNLKIYKQVGINPYNLSDIVEKFWENKDLIVVEFCIANPYKFTKEELSITSDFKKGFRDIFIIAKFEPEYTAIMNESKTYMVKGINDNLDNIVSYQDLPYTAITSIIPFKDNLIYDGILQEFGIEMGHNFEKIINEEYAKSVKYYHL